MLNEFLHSLVTGESFRGIWRKAKCSPAYTGGSEKQPYGN